MADGINWLKAAQQKPLETSKQASAVQPQSAQKPVEMPKQASVAQSHSNSLVKSKQASDKPPQVRHSAPMEFVPQKAEAKKGSIVEEKLPDGIQGVLARVDRTLARSYLTNMELAWPCGQNSIEAWQQFYRKNQEEIALFKLTHFVFSTGEDVRERLKTFYSAVHGLSGHPSVFFVLDSQYSQNTRKTQIDFYFGIRMQESQALNDFSGQFRDLLLGYFPGTQVDHLLSKNNIAEFHKRILSMETPQVACVSAQASPQKDAQGNPVFQGLEGLVDVMLGHSYTAIVIAQSVSPTDNAFRQRQLENYYTHLSSFQKVTQNYSTSQNETLGLSISEGVTDGTSSTFTRTSGSSYTSSSSRSDSYGTSSSDSFMGSTTGSSSSTSYSTSTSYGVSSSTSEAEGTSHSISVTSGKNVSTSSGVTHGINVETTNKAIVEILKRLELAIDQHEKAVSYGSWDCAAYFIASLPSDALLAANTYKSLICGDESSNERPYLALWNCTYGAKNYDGTGMPRQTALLYSILNGCHPTMEGGVQKAPFVPTATVNGDALPYFLSPPLKSIPGVVVDQMATFERSVLISSSIRQPNPERLIKLGDIYHLGQRDGVKSTNTSEKGRAVELDLDAFTGHCLVTGSTGSGKSNTVGVLLNRFYEKKIPFLVVEPAKGEYRSDFAWVRQHNHASKRINVFTTNPLIGRLLRINPFRFPETAHVLEHIDRLLVIFNSCWEMSEAMPALLKKAVERAYLMCGWRLEQSRCIHNSVQFPTFYTLLQTLRQVIDESEYDDRAKKIYKGALLSRVESLSTGLSGAIFEGSRDIDDSVLFGENTIVDLSRLGSAETKSLIMGVLVMALNEYRVDESFKNPDLKNAKLRHVTILEEAHNLLRNSAASAGGASATVAKSIESLSNAIAEMRTYGEGFLIVDQSPGALDISATRNTNTKIIMRLPEQQDCEAMAKALALEEDQGKEIAKLNPGVAVVFQNTWRAPVLTLVDKAPEHSASEGVQLTSTAQAYFKLNCYAAHRFAEVFCAYVQWKQTNKKQCLERNRLNELVKRVNGWLLNEAHATVCSEVAPEQWAQYQTLKASIEAQRAITKVENDFYHRATKPTAKHEGKSSFSLPLAQVAVADIVERFRSLAKMFERFEPSRKVFYAFGACFVELLGLQNEWRNLLRVYRDSKSPMEVRNALNERLLTEYFFFADDSVPDSQETQRRREIMRYLYCVVLSYYVEHGVLSSGGSEKEQKAIQTLFMMNCAKQ